MAAQVQGVIFDYGGVLCFHPEDEKIARAAALCGVEPTAFVRALWTDRLVYDGGQHPREYWSNVAKLLDRTFDDAMVAQMVECEVEFWGRLDARVLDWIKQLRAHKLRVGILSNLPSPLGARLRDRDGFLDHFDHITFSFELGIIKPQRGIYEHAVGGLNLPPENTLFLDDRPENIEGARQAGMQAELYTTWEQFVLETPARYGLPAPAVARRQ